MELVLGVVVVGSCVVGSCIALVSARARPVAGHVR